MERQLGAGKDVAEPCQAEQRLGYSAAALKDEERNWSWHC